MFFRVKIIKGNPYLTKVLAFRNRRTGNPTNKERYVGAVTEIEKVINHWREQHGVGAAQTSLE